MGKERKKKKKNKESGVEQGKGAPGKREELGIPILGRGVLSPLDVGPSDLVFLAPIRSSRLPPYHPSPHQSPTFGPTHYKFIVKGPLGLDFVRRWVRSEEQDPTIGTVCGKGCSCDDECDGLLR